MKTLNQVTGSSKPEPIKFVFPNLKVGDNFFNVGKFKDICSSCMQYKDIIYIFKLQNGKVLSQRCERCFD